MSCVWCLFFLETSPWMLLPDEEPISLVILTYYFINSSKHWLRTCNVADIVYAPADPHHYITSLWGTHHWLLNGAEYGCMELCSEVPFRTIIFATISFVLENAYFTNEDIHQRKRLGNLPKVTPLLSHFWARIQIMQTNFLASNFSAYVILVYQTLFAHISLVADITNIRFCACLLT